MRERLNLLFIIALCFIYTSQTYLFAQTPIHDKILPKTKATFIDSPENFLQSFISNKSSKFKINKLNFTEDAIDSIIVVTYFRKFKTVFNYNSSSNKISTTNYSWNETTSIWRISQKTEYSYDSFGNLVAELEIRFNINSGVPTNNKKISYTHDNNGNRLTEKEEKWDSDISDWINVSFATRTYDANNNLLQRIRQLWDSDAATWEKYGRLLYCYDTQNNLLEFTIQNWVEHLQIWGNYSQNVYTYNSNNTLTSEIYGTWSTHLNNWVPWHRHNYFFDSQEKLIIYLLEGWNGADTNWHNERLNTYYYNSSNQLIKNLEQRLDFGSGIMELWNLTTYEYDAEGNRIGELMKGWNSLDEVWQNNTRLTFNNNNGDMTFWLREYWNTHDSVWELNERKYFDYNTNHKLTFYKSEIFQNSNWVPSQSIFNFNNTEYVCTEISAYYHQLTDISDQELTLKQYSLSQNYPNPFNPTTSIEFDIQQYGNSYLTDVKLVVFDLLGREVKTLVNEQKTAGKHKVNFDAYNLPSGIYFYQLQADKFIQSKKMLLIK